MTSKTWRSERSWIGSQSNHDRARARVALVEPPGRLPRPCGTFLGAHAHGAGDPAAEAGMRLQVARQFPLDRSALRRARAPSYCRRWKPAPFLDAVQEGLAGGDVREDQGHAVRKGCPDVLDGSWPFDAFQRRVDGDQLVAGNDTGQQDRHCMAVLAASRRDGNKSAGPDHLPAFRRDVNVGEPGRHGGISRLAASGPLHGLRLRPGDRRRPPLEGVRPGTGIPRIPAREGSQGPTAKGTGLNRPGWLQ